MSSIHKGKRYSPNTEIKPGTRPPGAKINENIAEEIRKEYNAGGISQRKLALKYNVSRPTIGNVLKNKFTYKYNE